MMTFGERTGKECHNKALMSLNKERALERVGRGVCAWEAALADLLLAQGRFSCRASPSQNRDWRSLGDVVAWSHTALPDKTQDAEHGWMCWGCQPHVRAAGQLN